MPVPVDTTPSDGYYIAASAERENIFTVNLNPALCPSAPSCQAEVDGDVVWRDKDHLVAEYAANRRHRKWELIEQTGVLDGAT